MRLITMTNMSLDGVLQGLGGPDVALELVEARPTPSGIIIQTYRVDGKPVYRQAEMESTEVRK